MHTYSKLLFSLYAFLLLFVLIYLNVHVLCLCVSVPCGVFTTPEEGIGIPGTAIARVLGSEPVPSASALLPLNQWVISPALILILLHADKGFIYRHMKRPKCHHDAKSRVSIITSQACDNTSCSIFSSKCRRGQSNCLCKLLFSNDSFSK